MMDQEEAYEVFLEHVFSTTTVNEENDIVDAYDVNFVSLKDMFSFLNEQEKRQIQLFYDDLYQMKKLILFLPYNHVLEPTLLRPK